MPYLEDDYLPLSGIQHFSFCRRQWALIYVEELWEENVLTVEGQLLHEKAHDPFFTEKRRDVIITREMAIHSGELGASGKCDVVEFFRDDDGIALFGREGRWLPKVVEYKHGKPKIDDCDRLQLAAQAICLEEMLGCREIEESYLYYGETRRRELVDLTDELRTAVKDIFGEMHAYYERCYTPRVKPTKSCQRCSLNSQCLPGLMKQLSVSQYIAETLSEDVKV